MPAGVKVEDGDRVFTLSATDEGHVTVVLKSGTADEQTYDLDFDAASGLSPAAAADPSAEHVPANTNGVCIFKVDDLTITAVQPLFAPGTINLTVDNGVDEPTTHVVEIVAQEDAFPPIAPPGAASALSTIDEPNAIAAALDEPAESVEPTADAESTEDEPAEPDPEPDTETPVADSTDEEPEPAEDSPEPVEDAAEPSEEPADAEPAEAEAAEAEAAEPDPVVPVEPAAAKDAGDTGSDVVLVPDQSTGETERSSRGNRWSVHGDLFDKRDPVYAMHGVLGADDLDGT
ncbi:MAG TPA: hypothetical protein VNP92_07080 [Actinophytocola sp.]|nr:hypothetical protein [Actinophytocola sp.]